jgi:hypothetical protein
MRRLLQLDQQAIGANLQRVASTFWMEMNDDTSWIL